MLDKAAARIRSEDPTISAWIDGYWDDHRQRLADDLDLVAEFDGRILDVGAAPFFTTLALHLQGRDVTGVDIDPSRISLDGPEVLACDIERERIPAANGSFDVVLLSEVFEHLRVDLLHTVGELRRVLAPGGVLLVTTPNLWSVRGLVRLLLRRQAWAVSADPAAQFAKLHTVGHMGHVREYTAVEARGVLEACGFTVERVIYRRKAGPRWARGLEQLVCPMRPYMTLVARA